MWFKLLGTILSLIPLLFLGVAGWWHVQGGQVLAVQTSSMAPGFRPGDAVLVRPLDWQRLKSGDVISYHSTTEPGTIVSHRIVRHVPGAGFITKGDRLAQPDPQVAPWQIIGQVVAVAPRFGSAMQWLHKPLGLALAVYLPVVAWLTYESRHIGRSRLSVYRLNR